MNNNMNNRRRTTLMLLNSRLNLNINVQKLTDKEVEAVLHKLLSNEYLVAGRGKKNA